MRRYVLTGLVLWTGAFAQQQPTIKATSQEDLLDLVVRDKKGHLVNDLKAGEISVTDDGVEQTIRPVNPLRDVRVVTFAFDPLPGSNFNNERTCLI